MDTIKLIENYFANILFTKVDYKENFAVYAALLSSSYNDQKRPYILVFVPIKYSEATADYIHNLKWQSLQTRILKYNYKMKPQKWDIPRNIPNLLLYVTNRTDTSTTYVTSDNIIEMMLLHDLKKKSKYQYQNRMDLLTSLVTYKCIINIIGDHLIIQPVINNNQSFIQTEHINNQSIKIPTTPII